LGSDCNFCYAAAHRARQALPIRRVGRIFAYARYPNRSIGMSKTDQGRRRQHGAVAAGAREPKPPFLASNAHSSYITGTVLQVMGGETTGG